MKFELEKYKELSESQIEALENIALIMILGNNPEKLSTMFVDLPSQLPSPPADNRSPLARMSAEVQAVPTSRVPSRTAPARQEQLPDLREIGKIPFQNIVGYKGAVEEV